MIDILKSVGYAVLFLLLCAAFFAFAGMLTKAFILLCVFALFCCLVAAVHSLRHS